MQTNIKHEQLQTTGPEMQNIFEKLPIDVPNDTHHEHIKSNQLPIKKQIDHKSYLSCATSSQHIQPQKKDINASDALKMPFNTHWSVWIHKNTSKDWSLNSYSKIMTIYNVGDFWSFMNSFNKINYMDFQFFVMRGDIIPIWEEIENRNGGAASIRLKLSDKNLLPVWEDICLHTLNENICDASIEINGVSFNLKNDLTVIKIWNKDGNCDISKKITRNITGKYRLNSIVYIKNRPEY